MGSPDFDYGTFTLCGASFKRFARRLASPLSLAATYGIAVAFFSFRY